jgi:hypothetical protein
MIVITVKKSLCLFLLVHSTVTNGLRAAVIDAKSLDEGPALPSAASPKSNRKLEELNSAIATLKDEAKSSLPFEGPSFMVGLEVNTTQYGQINRRVIGDVLSAKMYSYLRQELPYKYHLEKIVIEDVQTLSLELVRSLRGLAQIDSIITHEFVVTASTVFSTDEIPSNDELHNLVLAIRLPLSIFQNSTNPVLRSTTGAKLFPLRTSTSALISQENDPAESSIFKEYSTLIFLGSGLALFTLMASITYYKKSSTQSKEVQVNAKQVVADKDSSIDLEEAFPCEKSVIGNGVLFVASESASCSDDSLVEERGLNDISVCLPNRYVAGKVVNEVEEGTFSCGFEVPSQQKRMKQLDIDSVMCDSDSEYENRRKKNRDYKLKAKLVNEVVDSGMSCGIRLPMTNNAPLDIDTIVAESDSESEEGRSGKSGKKRNLPGDKNIELVPRVARIPSKDIIAKRNRDA